MLTFARARARHRRRSVVALLSSVAVAVTIAGCGSVAPAPGDTFEVRAASTAAEQACAPSAAAICERAEACSPFWFARFYTSVATCAAVFNERCVDRYRGPGAANEIADCSSAVRSLSCEHLIDPVLMNGFEGELLSSCQVTLGAFGVGERCLRDGDCTTGHCALEKDCGKCATPVARPTLLELGEACTTDAACASRWCSAGKCNQQAQLGEACAERPCDLVAGLTCGSDLVCRPFGTARVGMPCSLADYCEAGARCAGILDGNATCEVTPSAGVGESCERGCAPELACVSGKCAAPRFTRLKSCPSAKQ